MIGETRKHFAVIHPHQHHQHRAAERENLVEARQAVEGVEMPQRPLGPARGGFGLGADGHKRQEYIHRGNDHAPDRGNAGNLHRAQTAGAVIRFEGGQEHQHLTGKVGEARQADGSHGGNPKHEGQCRRGLGQPAQVRQIERTGAALDAVGQPEQQGDGNAVGKHQDDGRGPGQRVLWQGDERRDG